MNRDQVNYGEYWDQIQTMSGYDMRFMLATVARELANQSPKARAEIETALRQIKECQSRDKPSKLGDLWYENS